MADPLGNAIMLGTEWSRFELSRAAKKVILVADEIVHTDCMRQFPNLVRIPDIVVDAVVYWPFAAWPQSSPGLYDVDEDHMRSMNKTLATEETTQQYLKEYVFSYQSHLDYLDMIGNETREKITQTETSFLMDPYRKWILSADEIAKLVLEGER
jgi:glutaconate CoA-transferase subunit A